MSDFLININENDRDNVRNKSIYDKIYSYVVVKKFNSPVGYIWMILFSLALTLYMIKSGYQTGVVLVAGIIGAPMAVASMFNMKFGVVMMVIIAFFLNGLKRFIYQMAHADVPLGLAMDILVVVMIFGLFVNQYEKRDWSFAKNSITLLVAVWILYNLVQFANPAAVSKAAWAYTVRSFAGIMLMFFIFAYAIDSIKFVRNLLILCIVLSFLGAIWGFVQEHNGFAGWEMQDIIDNEKVQLYFIAGHWRKFSFFSDPMIFGIIMSYMAVMCISLVSGPFKKWVKVLLIILTVFMFNTMLYSGTRAAYVLPMAAFVLYTVLKLNTKIIVTMLIGTVLFLIVLNMPSGNPNIRRFQTAFKPGEDASYQVREQNQAYIRPFIHSHPLGGGLGSTGVWGQRFSPHSMLAKFPPDSGYVRIAVEAGWLGLIIYMSLLFVTLKTGIKSYLRVKNPELKAYLLATIMTLFALVVANFPQEAIGQYPTNLIFFMLLAIISKASALDKNFSLKKET